MKTFRKPRSDSYEANISPEDREHLYAWLLQPGLSLKEPARRAPPWRTGKRAGRKPDSQAVAKISRRMRTETGLAELEAAALVQQVVLNKILEHIPPGQLHEEITDLCMRFIGQDVIHKTLQQLDPDSRTDAAKLLLQRSDQNLDRQKFYLLLRKYADEAKAAKEKAQQAGEAGHRQGGIPAEVLAQIEKELKLL